MQAPLPAHASPRGAESFARYEQIRKFALLPRELSVEGGELTPTLKVKRKVVDTKYVALLEALYAGEATDRPNDA